MMCYGMKGLFTGINVALFLAAMALGYKVYLMAMKEKGDAKKLGVFVSIAIISLSLIAIFYTGAKKVCHKIKRCKMSKTGVVSKDFRKACFTKGVCGLSTKRAGEAVKTEGE